MKSLEELLAIKEKAQAQLAARDAEGNDGIRVVVGMATCGIAAGARPVMNKFTEEIERENNIINSLLSLVKMDKTSADLNVKSENINDLVERILKRVRPIAALRNIEIVFESFRPVTAEIDEVKFSLAISNLVENAIKYNKTSSKLITI